VSCEYSGFWEEAYEEQVSIVEPGVGRRDDKKEMSSFSVGNTGEGRPQ
jgi:hypothetical protein